MFYIKKSQRKMRDALKLVFIGKSDQTNPCKTIKILLGLN